MPFAPQYTPRGPEIIMRGAEAMGQGINQGLNQFGAGLGQHLERLKEEKKEADTLRGFLKSAPGSTDPDYKTKIDALSLPKLRQQATEVRSKLEMEQAELDREAKLLQISRIKDEMSRMNRQDAALAELPALFNQAQGDVIAGTENINPPNLMPVVAKLAQAGYKPDDIDGIMRVMQAGGSRTGDATVRQLNEMYDVVEKPGTRQFQVLPRQITGSVAPITDPQGNPLYYPAPGNRAIPAPGAAEQASAQKSRVAAMTELGASIDTAERRINSLERQLESGKSLLTNKPHTPQEKAGIERQLATIRRLLESYNADMDKLSGDDEPSQPKPAKPPAGSKRPKFDKAGNRIN